MVSMGTFRSNRQAQYSNA